MTNWNYCYISMRPIYVYYILTNTLYYVYYGQYGISSYICNTICKIFTSSSHHIFINL